MKVSQVGTFLELLKFLQVQSQKTIKCCDETGSHEDMRTATGKEDPELPLLQRIRLELSASFEAEIKCFKVQLTDISKSQNQLFRGDCVNQAFKDKFISCQPQKLQPE